MSDINSNENKKVTIDDLGTDTKSEGNEGGEGNEEVKGLKKILKSDSELTKQAKQLYNDEVKFQASLTAIRRNYLKLDGYKGLIYLSKMSSGDAHFEDLKNRIIGWEPPSETCADGIKDRKEFRQMKEVKDFLLFLDDIHKVYKDKKRYAMQKLVKVLKENIFYHEWTQGAFRSARFTAGQVAKNKRQGNSPGDDEDDDDLV